MNGHTIVGDKKTSLLCHTTDPEMKRKIIGDTFMNVANRIIQELNLDPEKVQQRSKRISKALSLSFRSS